ncbi:MAG: MarR family transcriptional regulator [Propionibacteriaceae bacterium]|jgi:DNA-binding MarR family transcriptional regulator|nr:MarR family transcriptional regulator [Propionibacteriaceae bacterium]
MEDLARRLDQRLRRLSWLLQRQDRLRWSAAPGRPADPNAGQGRVLALLRLRDGVSTKDLSFLLGIRTSSLNQTLARLEQAGLTRREPSPGDRRVMLVKLTDRGRRDEPAAAEAGDVYACLDQREQTELCAYLDRLIAALERDLGPSPAEASERLAGLRQRLGEDYADYFQRSGGQRGWPGAGGRPGGDPRSNWDGSDPRGGGRGDPRADGRGGGDPRDGRAGADPRSGWNGEDPRNGGRGDPRADGSRGGWAGASPYVDPRSVDPRSGDSRNADPRGDGRRAGDHGDDGSRGGDPPGRGSRGNRRGHRRGGPPQD